MKITFESCQLNTISDTQAKHRNEEWVSSAEVDFEMSHDIQQIQQM